jgi:hypothetical protein
MCSAEAGNLGHASCGHTQSDTDPHLRDQSETTVDRQAAQPRAQRDAAIERRGGVDTGYIAAVPRPHNPPPNLYRREDRLVDAKRFPVDGRATVVDLAGFSEQSTADIERYVDSLSPAQRAKIIRMGF